MGIYEYRCRVEDGKAMQRNPRSTLIMRHPPVLGASPMRIELRIEVNRNTNHSKVARQPVDEHIASGLKVPLGTKDRISLAVLEARQTPEQAGISRHQLRHYAEVLVRHFLPLRTAV
jgi:hypothetical protein